ncbi:MAG: LysR family transcriptional regulator [Lachnospiraceae bacterium]|nr:LysR family transcriptional regulator [Lachnospiraceae bacterium]
MDTKYLSYILEIAKYKNMRRAAEKLYVSQPSLSQYLNKLEQELGTPLFVRSKKELTLTPAGELYVNCAQKMISMKEQLYKDIANLSASVPIKIATTATWGHRVIGDIVPAFSQFYPHVQIEILEGNLSDVKAWFSNQAVDFVLIATNNLDNYEQHQLLSKEQIVFAIPSVHPFCQTEAGTSIQITPKQITEYFSDDYFILAKKASSVRFVADEILKYCEFVPKTAYSINHMNTIKNLVCNNGGVAFIPITCALKDPHIRYYTIQPQFCRLDALVYKKERLNQYEEHLVSLIKHHPLFDPESADYMNRLIT